MSDRDELADILMSDELVTGTAGWDGRDYALAEADAILAAGYRKIFCGLSNVKDPTEREAAEAWMRWANLAINDEIGAIGAMKQMLAELGYRKPRTITTAEELDALPQDAVVRDADRCVFDRDHIIDESHPLRWHPAGVAVDVGSEFIALPATVLYEPEPTK
jgi:hypothetical protein